jgi:hypothetical protein
LPLFTTLAALSQTAASNPPDGAVDPPSSIDDQMRLLGAFIAQLRDGSGFAVTAFAPIAGPAYTAPQTVAFSATPTFNAALSNVFYFRGADGQRHQRHALEPERRPDHQHPLRAGRYGEPHRRLAGLGPCRQQPASGGQQRELAGSDLRVVGLPLGGYLGGDPMSFAARMVATPTFNFTLSTSGAGIDFRAQAVAAGWNQVDYVVGTLNSSSTANSGGTGAAGTNALTIAGSFPQKGRLEILAGKTLTGGAGGAGSTGSTGSAGANGAAGAGGRGYLDADGLGPFAGSPGGGGSSINGGTGGAGGAGGNGGTALVCSVAGFQVNNLGTITNGAAGGGGSGGSGGSPGTPAGGGGGGGGAALNIAGDAWLNSGNGGNGYSVAAGGPFSGTAGQSASGRTSGTGGTGGASGCGWCIGRQRQPVNRPDRSGCGRCRWGVRLHGGHRVHRQLWDCG